MSDTEWEGGDQGFYFDEGFQNNQNWSNHPFNSSPGTFSVASHYPVLENDLEETAQPLYQPEYGTAVPSAFNQHNGLHQLSHGNKILNVNQSDDSALNATQPNINRFRYKPIDAQQQPNINGHQYQLIDVQGQSHKHESPYQPAFGGLNSSSHHMHTAIAPKRSTLPHYPREYENRNNATTALHQIALSSQTQDDKVEHSHLLDTAGPHLPRSTSDSCLQTPAREFMPANIATVAECSVKDYLSGVTTVLNLWGLDLTKNNDMSKSFGYNVACVNHMRTLAIRYPGKGRAVVDALVVLSKERTHHGKAKGTARALQEAKENWHNKRFKRGNFGSNPDEITQKNAGLQPSISKDESLQSFRDHLQLVIIQKVQGRKKSDFRSEAEFQTQLSQAADLIKSVLDSLDLAQLQERSNSRGIRSLKIRAGTVKPRLQKALGSSDSDSGVNGEQIDQFGNYEDGLSRQKQATQTSGYNLGAPACPSQTLKKQRRRGLANNMHIPDDPDETESAPPLPKRRRSAKMVGPA
ncbi:MAG: hypothetical protein MMC33_003868 [Icmadophila ericetorum]|nr:hypothetical protein [Icmadophila ericetorum]